MGRRPSHRFPAPCFIMRNHVVKGQLETAFWRIRRGLHTFVEVEPAHGLALAIALEPAKPLRCEKQARSLFAFLRHCHGVQTQAG